MSLSPGKTDTDKSGNICNVYDVIVNTNTLQRSEQDREFRRFVCAIAIQYIHSKSEPHMNADEFTNLNFKVKGKLSVQRIKLSEPQEQSDTIQKELNIPKTNQCGTEPTKRYTNPTGKLIEEVDTVIDKLPEDKLITSTNCVDPNEANSSDWQFKYEIHNYNTYNWSNHPNPTTSSYYVSNPPELLLVNIHLNEVKPSELDIQLDKNSIYVLNVSTHEPRPTFVISLPFPIDPEPTSRVKYLKKKQVLCMQLHVVIPIHEERTAPCKDAAEEEDMRLNREQRNRQLAEEEQMNKRIKYDEENRKVCQDRKELAENVHAMQQGMLPPSLEQHLNSMPDTEKKVLLQRIEGHILKGDALDTLIEKLTPDMIHTVTSFLRSKLLLEPLPPKVSTKKPDTSSVEESYGYSNKTESLFGFTMSNRYLFALDY